MIFRVAWTKPAGRDLEALLLLAGDSEEVVRAVRTLDQRLQREGDRAGESRVGTLRVVIESPLTCYFRYRAADRTVIVVSLGDHRRRQ